MPVILARKDGLYGLEARSVALNSINRGRRLRPGCYSGLLHSIFEFAQDAEGVIAIRIRARKKEQYTSNKPLMELFKAIIIEPQDISTSSNVINSKKSHERGN